MRLEQLMAYLFIYRRDDGREFVSEYASHALLRRNSKCAPG
jgi:hypothetical protein